MNHVGGLGGLKGVRQFIADTEALLVEVYEETLDLDSHARLLRLVEPLGLSHGALQVRQQNYLALISCLNVVQH